VQEALSLWVDDAPSAELEFQYHLPKDWRDVASGYKRARARAADAEAQAQALATAAAFELIDGGQLSMRDAAELLGLSHQRVQQLVSKPRRRLSQRGRRASAR
jgi:DNA-directed RNA polymerase specialized sigma24 family protein